MRNGARGGVELPRPISMSADSAGAKRATLHASATGVRSQIGLRGRVDAASDPFDSAALRAALAEAVAGWRVMRRAVLLRRAFVVRSVGLPLRGTLRLAVRPAGGGPLLARGAREFFVPYRALEVRAGLTRRGHALLRRKPRPRVTAVLSFEAADGQSRSERRTTALRR